MRAYESGATQEGWGPSRFDDKGNETYKGFMPRYMGTEFRINRAKYGYDQGQHVAALVMRSMRAVCIDIDGKNGGLQGALALGNLPLTLAETSKSGTGYHLYYETDEVWDSVEGFALIPDQIAFAQGVDIRGVGCVYHFPSQRWNTRNIAPLPEWLRDRLLEKKQKQAAQSATISKTLASLDETEILLMHATLLEELKKPIPAGRRNNTLFAIGCQLKAAEVDDWQKAVHDRALKVGLDYTEADKLIENIEKQ